MATTAADLYRADLFPVVVFSGGNSPTTRARFPRGEAVHDTETTLESLVPIVAFDLDGKRCPIPETVAPAPPAAPA